jgi:hypothetical protein
MAVPKRYVPALGTVLFSFIPYCISWPEGGCPVKQFLGDKIAFADISCGYLVGIRGRALSIMPNTRHTPSESAGCAVTYLNGITKDA